MSKVMTKVTFFISRSKSLGKTKFWNAVKGLVTINPHIKYEGPTSYDKEAIAKVKVYQIQWSMSLDQTLWYDVKALASRNVHV